MSGIVIGIIVGLIGLGAWTVECINIGGHLNEARVQKAEKAQADAQAKLDAAQAKADQEAKNKVIDMAAAYEAGEANAKTINNTYVQRGASDVAKYPVFRNPDCVLPDDSLHQLNSARAGLQPTADPGQPPAAVPGAPAAFGWEVRDPVPTKPSGSGAVVGVPPTAGKVGGGGQVPANGVQPVHPKPKPVE